MNDDKHPRDGQVPTILVAGDLVLDHHIYEGRRHHFAEDAGRGVSIHRQVGGAAVIHELLVELFRPRSEEAPVVARSMLAVDDLAEREAALTSLTSEHAYAFWRPAPRYSKDASRYWRVAEPMGFGELRRNEDAHAILACAAVTSSPSVLVISDGGMGFREAEGEWGTLPFAQPAWIVLKTSEPVGQGQLWDRLTKSDIRDRVVVIVSVRELRKSKARLHSGLSWDESVEGLLAELQPGGALDALTACRHLIVSYDSEGAVWIDLQHRDAAGRPSPGCVAHVIYEAGAIEGDHASTVEGSAFGLLSCLAAAVSRHLLFGGSEERLASAIESGLSAMRDLRERGHGPAQGSPRGFPARRLAEVIERSPYRFSRAAVTLGNKGQRKWPPASAQARRRPEGWSLLQQTARQAGPEYERARQVLLNGPIALHNLPHLRIGKHVAVERREIETLRTLVQCVRRYKASQNADKPLSIGVFGPPGAGKSFAVKQIAVTLFDPRGWLEFNLSQFAGPEELNGAFHQIRDVVLQGWMPIAFFDEFDSQKYRWLQYLLAPMQDGKFQDGQLTHTLGKAVLVFAGGTSWTYATFGPGAAPEPEQEQGRRNFRMAKGPDFKSRLDVYLDVLGPNPRRISPPPDGTPSGQIDVCDDHKFGPDPTDIVYPIRRALMLRSSLDCEPDQHLEMDEGVIDALLRAPKYTHGTRSLGKLVEPLRPAISAPIPRSLLPPLEQLEMHTMAGDFLELLDNSVPVPPVSPLSDQDAATIAAYIHETWRDTRRREGRPPEAALDEPLTELLARHGRDPAGADPIVLEAIESSTAAAHRIPHVLATIGLRVAAGGSRGSDAAVLQHLESYLELLAQEEHILWMRRYLRLGWQYGKPTDKSRRLHACLIPYSQLDDSDKNTDRYQVRKYPELLAAAKKRIEFA